MNKHYWILRRTRRVQMFIDGMTPCTFDPVGVVLN